MFASRPARCGRACGLKGDEAGTSTIDFGEEGAGCCILEAGWVTIWVGWVKYGDCETTLSSSSSSSRSSRRRPAGGEEENSIVERLRCRYSRGEGYFREGNRKPEIRKNESSLEASLGALNSRF
jgi:hypothetical protein